MSAPSISQTSCTIDRSGNVIVIAVGSDGSLWEGSWVPAQGPKATAFVWQLLPPLP